MNKSKQKFADLLQNRNFTSALLTAVIIVAIVFVNVIIYTLAYYFGWYFTPQAQDDLSISGATDTLFSDAIDKGERVEIIFCSYEDTVKNHQTGKFVYETARQFEERYPNFVDVRFVNVVTQIDSEGNPFDSAKYAKDMRGRDNAVSPTSVIFRCGDNYRVLTDVYTTAGYADFYTLTSETVASSYNGEEVIAAMICWVLSSDHGTAYFTTGHGETADIFLHNTLICAGYYVEEINLKKDEVPEDAALVVISNPKMDFERSASTKLRSEIERMNAYSERGGNYFVVLDPEVKRLPVLELFISDFGISLERDESGETVKVKDTDKSLQLDGFTIIADHSDSEIAVKMHAKTEPYGDGVLIKNVAALSLDKSKAGVTPEPLLKSSSTSVTEAGGRTVDSSGNYTVAAYSLKDNELGDDAAMFVMPSIYLASTNAIVTNRYANKDFLYSLCECLFGAGSMPYGCNSVVYDDGILENLPMGAAKLYTAALVAIPVIIAAVGAVVMIRRKNR